MNRQEYCSQKKPFIGFFIFAKFNIKNRKKMQAIDDKKIIIKMMGDKYNVRKDKKQSK